MTSCGNPCACLCLKGPTAALAHTWHTVSEVALNSADSSIKEKMMVLGHPVTRLEAVRCLWCVLKIFTLCADGPRRSKAAGSPGFGGLDSSPVIQQRKKRPFRASEDALLASLLGSLHQACAAHGQPAPAQELPTPAWEPLAQVALRSPEPPCALPEPVTTFDDQEAAEFLGLESLSEAEVGSPVNSYTIA